MFPSEKRRKVDTDAFLNVKKSQSIKLPLKVTTVDTKFKPLNECLHAPTKPEPVPVFFAAPVFAAPPDETTIITVKPDFYDDFSREHSFGQIEDWIRKPSKPLLIVGHTGSGKSAAIEFYFWKHYKAKPEIYDDDCLLRENKIEECTDFIRPTSLLKKQLPAVFDNIESYDNVIRDVLWTAIEKPSKFRPLIFTTDDLFVEPAKSFSKFCVVVKLDLPDSAFISKCVKAAALKKGLSIEPLLKSILDVSYGNISCALNCIQWCSMDKISRSFLDRPSDVPKATRLALLGEDVPLLGGSSDTSFIGHMLQINVLQTTSSIHRMADTLEKYSVLDALDSVDPDKKMLTEHLWLFTELICKNGPKLDKRSKFNLEWPKSMKKKVPWTFGGYFYECV
jgi:hypothetical protein